MKNLLVIALMLVSSVGRTALPPEAQTYLNKIPEKKLTLPFVIKAAVLNAQAYRQIGLKFTSAHLEEMAKIDAVTDTQLVAGLNYADDNSVKTNPFQSLRSQQAQWNLGLQKKWEMGTVTSLSWVQQDVALEFANLGTLENSFVNDYKQSVAEIQLQQSLLKDSFGYSFRARKKATQSRGQSIQWETRKDFEEATLAFINQYYNSWLLQQNVLSLKANVQRQKRLVKVMTARSRKGAISRPDLIQIETLLATTKTNLSAVKTTLANRWDALAISLGFPKSFLRVDPMDIPILVDNPAPLALRLCGLKEPTKTAEIRTLEKKLEGLKYDFRANRNEQLPDLKLVAGYKGNSIDDRAAVTFNNVLNGDDSNGFGRGPVWHVGFQLNWPLANSGARAQLATTFIEKERVASQLQSAVDDLQIQWRDLCRQLRVETENEKVFQNIVLEQKKRVKADEKRFRLGRLSVNQFIDAETDLGDWEFRSHQKKVEVRALAWQVQQTAGELYKKLDPLVNTLLKDGHP